MLATIATTLVPVGFVIVMDYVAGRRNMFTVADSRGDDQPGPHLDAAVIALCGGARDATRGKTIPLTTVLRSLDSGPGAISAMRSPASCSRC